MSEDRKEKKANISMGVWNLLQWLAPRFIVRKFNYTHDEIELDSPCLIVANHVTDQDPFLVGMAHKRSPVAFVASEHIFRMGLVSRLIKKLVAPIPRSKAASGASTVKNCLRRLRSGESVGLFAEGDRSWDGLTQPVFPATGKLAKASGAPLVTFRIEGGYLTSPRWADSVRPGSVHGSLVHIYSPEELKGMTAEEVTRAIDRDIFEDAWERQRNEKTMFSCEARAEGMEKAFVLCPKCGAVGQMSSKDNTVFCTACGFNAFVEKSCFFEEGAPFSTPAEWEALQKEELKKLFRSGESRPCGEAAVCRLTELGEGNGKGKKLGKVQLEADIGKKELIVGEKRIPFEDIGNMSMVRTNRLLFTAPEGYFELKCKNGVLRKYLLLWQAAEAVRTEGEA